MNEHELERRFRSVTEGPQPNAPQSLRRFLYSMPETVPAKPENPWTRFVRSFSLPAAPRLAGAGVVAFAVVAALFAANFVMNARSNVPGNSASAVPAPTPLRSFQSAGLVWLGTNEVTGPLPDVAVTGGPYGYMGVGKSASGRNVLLDSADGITWIQRAEPEVPAIDIASIAHMPGGGYVLAGGKDGRAAIYFSPDGAKWTAATKIDMPDVPVQALAANKLGFIAAGAAKGVGSPTSFWSSVDGKTWIGGSYGVSYTGTPWLRAEKDRFYVGATYLGSHPGQVNIPVAEIMDLTKVPSDAMSMLSAADESLADVVIVAALMFDDGSANVYKQPREMFLARGSSQNATELLLPTKFSDDGMGGGYWGEWGAIQPKLAGTTELQNDLSAIEMVGRLIVGADRFGGVYTSEDLGITWKHVPLDAQSNGPGGTRIVPLGNGKVLVTGEQNGVWLAWAA